MTSNTKEYQREYQKEYRKTHPQKQYKKVKMEVKKEVKILDLSPPRAPVKVDTSVHETSELKGSKEANLGIKVTDPVSKPSERDRIKKHLDDLDKELEFYKPPRDRVYGPGQFDYGRSKSLPKKDCNRCDKYGECDHQGAYRIKDRWCWE